MCTLHEGFLHSMRAVVSAHVSSDWLNRIDKLCQDDEFKFFLDLPPDRENLHTVKAFRDWEGGRMGPDFTILQGFVDSKLSFKIEEHVAKCLQYYKFIQKCWQQSVDVVSTLKVLVDFVGHKIRFRSLDLSHVQWLKVWRKFQIKYFCLQLFGLATKWLKYHFAAIFSLGTSQVLPDPLEGEAPGMFLTGVGYCFLRQAVFSRNPSILVHFLMAKRGMPSVTEWELYSATMNLGPDLETKRKPRAVRDLFDQRRVSSQEYCTLVYEERLGLLQGEVSRTVHELFKGSRPPVFTPSLPSLKSHYESSRQQGGALGRVTSDLESFGFEKQSRIVRSYDPPRVIVKGGTYWEIPYDFVEEFEGSGGPVCSWPLPEYFDNDALECIQRPSMNWAQRAYTLMEEFLKGASLLLDGYDEFSCLYHNRVTPVALPEPLKVRMITRGPAYRYWLLKGIQKRTWEVLANHPVFCAIGRPLQISDLDRMFMTFGLLGEAEAFRSGDYSRATDLIHPDLSLMVVETLSRIWELPVGVEMMYRSSLCGAEILTRIPDGQKPANWRFNNQVWGQLMGSVTSFPVLCIINAALNRFYLEMRYGVPLTLDQCPMLINGDDVLIRDIDSKDGLWDLVVADGGLVPSVGKNYVSKEFCIINSTLYEFHQTFVGPLFYEKPYLNLGLLNCSVDTRDAKRLAADAVSLDPTVWDLGQISHKLVQGFSYEDKDWIMSRFLSRPGVSSVLCNVSPGVSYFASKALGGLGLYASRPNLLTAEQLGYYTRIAGTRGDLAPCFPDVKTSATTLGLFTFVPSKSLWSDWFLDSTVTPMPGTGLYWDTLMGNLGRIRESLGESKVFRPEIHPEIFRPHKLPWRQGELCEFPWRKVNVSEYTDTYCPRGSLGDRNS